MKYVASPELPLYVIRPPSPDEHNHVSAVAWRYCYRKTCFFSYFKHVDVILMLLITFK